MTFITTTDAVNGTTADASLVNNNNTAIKNAVNGALDNSNLSASAAIVLSKLGQSGAAMDNVPYWNGSTWAPGAVSSIAGPSFSTVLDRETTTVDLVSTVAETTLYTYTVVANSMSTDRMVRVTLFGDYLHNNSAGDTITWRVKFGGTTIFADVDNFNQEAATNRQPWRLDLSIANTGATNSQYLSVLYTREKASQTPPTTGIGNATFNTYIAGGNLFANSTAAALDTTSNQDLVITGQWSASSANNSLRFRYASTELV